MNITDSASACWTVGYTPLPITSPDAPGKDAGKRPLLPAWQTIEITAEAIRSWDRTRPKKPTPGLRCGHLIGLDIDVRDAGLVNTGW